MKNEKDLKTVSIVTETMPARDYSNGKIYKIWHRNTTDIYLGATCSKSLQNIVSLLRNEYLHGGGTVAQTIVSHYAPQIEVIEEYPCNNKYELDERLKHYIQTLDCVNKTNPGTRAVPTAEYREMCNQRSREYVRDPEKLKARAKLYRQANKEKEAARHREYAKNNRDKLNESQRKYRENNIEHMREYWREYNKKKRELKKTNQEVKQL